MNSLVLGRDYLRRARVRRGALRFLFEHRAYSDVVREAQEVVELALKGALRVLGVEPPRVHDAAPYLNDVKQQLPPRWRRQLPVLQRVSRELAVDRSPAFYGDEELDQPASALFNRRDAKRAMEWADLSIELLADLLSLKRRGR